MRQRLIGFLKIGLTAEKLALCVALGAVLGVFPMPGLSTLLCLLVGWALGLNQPAMQSVNYLVYPLQLTLLIPFYRLGDSLFGLAHIPITSEGVKALLAAGWLHAMRVLWDTTLRAVLVWSFAAPSVAWAIYKLALPPIRVLARSRHQSTQ